MKIISPKKARVLRLVRYFTGKPCKWGHVSERRTSTRGCIECEKRKGKKWWTNSAAFFAEIRWRYGLTADDWDKMIQEHAGRCAVCGSICGNKKGRSIHIDHHRESGKVRGLLCPQHNHRLGFLETNMEMNRKLLEYAASYE